MSLILEALKRSEAERRQSSSGDSLPELTRTARSRRWLPWLAALTGVAALAVVASNWFGQDATYAPTNPPDMAVTVDPMETPIASHPAAGGSSGPGASPAPVDDPVPVPVPVPDPEPEPDTQTVAQRPIHSPAVVPPIIEPSVMRDETLVSWPVASEEPPPPTVTVDLAEPVESVTDSGNTDIGPQTRLPRFGQLPPATRQAIGELTLNIHVFDEQVSARFVLINLRRYHELDQLNDELRVTRIRADGVVLEYRGAAFLLPARS